MTMNPYYKLKSHLDHHEYVRGAFIGDAPALERRKTHVRVVNRGGCMAVRMYQTDLITAFPDGRVVLSMGGWNTFTTKANMYGVAREFLPYAVRFLTHYENKFPNLAVRIGGAPPIPWRDGLTLDADGRVIGELGTFKRYEADRAARKEFVARGKAFREALPLLVCMGKATGGRFGHPDQMTFAGEQWPQIVSAFWNPGGPKAIWGDIYRWACTSLVNVVSVTP